MSFITKRERVFNEYDLFDLPARNEGKLKAYASCTDARAWSHFCSDKTEHLVEVIKRNNETVRPKYVPTTVIVDTLMFAKNAEIARLKRKIEEFEQLLAAYDQLELSCDQKCEIGAAHAAIKAANKELDEMYLDLSSFTEALDSDAFETGKSRGDGEENSHHMYDAEEQVAPVTDVKAYQTGDTNTCEIGTFVTIEDPRIDEMQDIIVSKDAKLNAMKNTIAVMENDVCEPYCVYAHIYTALEKIFGVLCQNDKYRHYLTLLTSGKDTRCIDIKGKILFKLKILEKFSIALIAPCNKEFSAQNPNNDCECYRTEVITHIETNYAITTTERTQPSVDSKRAQLVADIIENEEMKDILSKQSVTDVEEAEKSKEEDIFVINEYNIDKENLDRLKKLQENYDDLMVCYETLKHEKECLEIRCHKYEELEKDFENLKLQISEYNSLWNEKEHYRKRSADLDILKEQYLILTDETANLETQLKAETEINNIKCKSIEELRNENVQLEKKLNAAVIAFEKEKNNLLCKLKEADCTVMCQGQQIKSLSVQIDRLLEQDKKTLRSYESNNTSIALIDEVESNRDQIKNLKDALFCNEEENINLQQQYQSQLQIITELRSELDDWKSAYEKTLQRNDYLEKYTASLIEENKVLSQDAKDKSQAIDNLMKMVDNKSQEINKLICESEKSKVDNDELCKQISKLQLDYDNSVASLENEKLQALTYLKLARAESQELLDKVKEYDEMLHSKTDLTKSLQIEIENKKELLKNAVEENKNLKMDLASRESNNSMLVQEIERLQEVHEIENKQYNTTLELTRKESSQLKIKLNHYETLELQLQSFQDSHEKLIAENKRLERELLDKRFELDNAIHSMQLTRRESYELIDKLQQSENAKDELLKLRDAYQKLAIEKHVIQTDLLERKNQVENLKQSFNNMRLSNEHLSQQCRQLDVVSRELESLKKSYDELLSEKNDIMIDLNAKKEALNNFYNLLGQKDEENKELSEQIKLLQVNQIAAKNSIQSLQKNNLKTEATLNIVKKESAGLIDKIKQYENIEIEFDQLKKAHEQIKLEKENLQSELNIQLEELKRIEIQNFELHCHSQNLISHSEDLENALITSRTELIKSSSSPDSNYKNIIAEIEKMREEKLMNQTKIRELLDKLEESENAISNLSEDVWARDDRIALLENHINALEDEVRQLHFHLTEMVNTGEEMKDFSFQKIDSIKIMEAHHSKATHNMKMELAKLQQQNAILEEQLSVSKIKSEESSRDNNIYVSQLVHLRDEREIIVTEIKDLEVTSMGDSALMPVSCKVEDILLSLDRIRKCLDARNSKTTFLEKTILKVQTSSQLLLSKADEAKILVEKEKQKIASEKEDAVKDRQNMERQLLELKEKLGKQISNDQAIIQDLEATILNQKLIIDKVNMSTQSYITKLKEELQNLQTLYHNSMAKIGELQEELQSMSEERNNQKNILDKIKTDLEAKSQEVGELQKELENLKHKPITNFGTQTKTANDDKESQTDKKLTSKEKVRIGYYDNNVRGTEKEADESTQFGHNTESQTNLINEVQILTAKVEPSFDYVRNSYTKYKIKCLSTVKLEQYSILRPNDNEICQESAESYSHAKDPAIVDIYNKQSMNTDLSKVNDGSENETSEKQSQNKSDEFITTDNNINGKYTHDKTATDLRSQQKNVDKDFFVIYKDSYAKKEQEKNKWPQMVEEEVTRSKLDRNRDKDQGAGQDLLLYTESTVDSVKQTLKINMPRIGNESNNSLMTPSEGEKKSLFSDTMPIYSSDTKISNDKSDGVVTSTPSLPTIPFDETLFLNEDFIEPSVHRDNLKTKSIESDRRNRKHKHRMLNTKAENPTNFDKQSHHKLSRVEANVLLLKAENGRQVPEGTEKQNVHGFGLQYLLDSVNGEATSDRSKRKMRSRSYEMLNNIEIGEKNADSSPTRLKGPKVTSKDFETIRTKPRNKDNATFAEQSVMVKLDMDTNYENALNSLTKALQNIETDYKKKIEAIKMQYDNNIRSIIKEHNQGVKNIQGLHEDTLHDMMKIHENEVENLRSMSIEAMRKAEKLEKENRALRTKVSDRGTVCLYEEPIKMSGSEAKKRKRNRGDTKMLTKTTVEAFDVKPKLRTNGPCTCTLDVNVSDTIRNIFEQVDVEQRKMAEHTFMKYIANKIMTGSIEALDGNELSFLHLKVCRMWKSKLSKEEALQKRIDSLESELMNKQRNAQQHIVDLDRKVAEERRRLQEVCEAVCRVTPRSSRACNTCIDQNTMPPLPAAPPPTADPYATGCPCKASVSVRRSAGDLGPRPRQRHNDRATTAKLDVEERPREKKLYNDEPPTRLRRSHDRQMRFRK